MKKIFLLPMFVVLCFLIIFGYLQTRNRSESTTVSPVECQEVCSHLREICFEDMQESDCLLACPEWDAALKQMIKQSQNCDELFVMLGESDESQSPALPEEMAQNGSECQMACSNYVAKCLTLVPGADQALFDEGLNSCLNECFSWQADKIECIGNAFDCPSMSEVCGL